jgi:hypothetical protein
LKKKNGIGGMFNFGKKKKAEPEQEVKEKNWWTL